MRRPYRILKMLFAKTNRELLLVTGLAGLTFSVSAEITPEKILVFSKGPMTLRPQLDVTETFNDNIFYRENNREADLVSVLSPGFELEFGQFEDYLRLSYTYDNILYAKNDSLNSDQHRLRLDNRLEWNAFSIEGRDEIEMLSSVIGGGISLRGIQIERTAYRDQYTFRYRISEKTSAYFEGQHHSTDYDHPLLFDSNSLLGTLGFGYDMFAKTSLFGEVYYGQTARNPNSAAQQKPPSSTVVGGFIGARGEFTPKLTGTVKAGYESRTFTGNVGGASSPVVSLTLTEAFSEKSVLSLMYNRYSQVSADVFFLSQYTADVINLTFTQWIGDDGRFRAMAGASYNRDTFDNARPAAGPVIDRSDDYWRGNLSFMYDIRRWSTVSLGYEFEAFKSSHPAVIDYNANKVILSLAIGY